MTSNDGPTLHILLSGDPQVGKLSLLQSQSGGLHPALNLQTLAGYKYTFWGTEIHGNTRRVVCMQYSNMDGRFIYGRTHVSILCFSLVDSGSYENVRTRWFPELREHNKDAVVFLCGMKSDLREAYLKNQRDELTNGIEMGNGVDVITYEQGLAMQAEIGAERYFECSLSTADEMFREAAVRAAGVADRRREKVESEAKRSTLCIIT